MREETKRALKLLEEAFNSSENPEVAIRVAATEFSKEAPKARRTRARAKCEGCEFLGGVSVIDGHKTIIWCEKTRSRITTTNFERGLKLLRRSCLRVNAPHVEMYSTVSRLR